VTTREDLYPDRSAMCTRAQPPKSRRAPRHGRRRPPPRDRRRDHRTRSAHHPTVPGPPVPHPAEVTQTGSAQTRAYRATAGPATPINPREGPRPRRRRVDRASRVRIGNAGPTGTPRPGVSAVVLASQELLGPPSSRQRAAARHRSAGRRPGRLPLRSRSLGRDHGHLKSQNPAGRLAGEAGSVPLGPRSARPRRWRRAVSRRR
jgi:hypothetical protein